MIVKGFDTLEFSLVIENYKEVLGDYLSMFKSFKENSHITGKEREIDLFGINFIVHRVGQKFYAYRISCKDFSIAFMESTSPNISPISVKFLSSYIWSYGLEQAISNFIEWFNNFNSHIIESKVSRLDICVDTDEWNLERDDIDSIVTRARNKTEHFVNNIFTSGHTLSGISIGSGDTLMARIYNKSLEIKSSGKVWFRDIWSEYNYSPDSVVWRVEFQIRRDVLKEFGIKQLQDIFTHIPNIWAYLTEKWLTIRQKGTDSNMSRWEISSKWKNIQKAHNLYNATPIIRESVKRGDLYSLLNQMAGLYLSVAAICDHNSSEETSFLVNTWLNDRLVNNDTHFREEVILRKRRFLLSSEEGVK